MAVVVECLAVWLFAERNSWRIRGDTELNCGMGQAVFRLAPQLVAARGYVKARGSHRRQAGEAIRQAIGGFLLRAVAHIMQSRAELPDMRQALRTAFTSTPSASTD